MEALVARYGYLALGLGTFLEGEAVLVAGGFAAHQGLLELPWVLASAFLGTLVGDQLYFQIGRRFGPDVLKWRPGWKSRADKALRLLERHQDIFILSFRFLYGLRTVSPFAIGMSRVPWGRFVVLNIIAAALWTTILGGLGYAFGSAMDTFLTHVTHLMRTIVLSIGAASLIYAALHFLRGRAGRHHDG